MMKTIRVFLLLLLLATVPAGGRADDAPEVSLLTCAPGPQVYERYGHTALRVKDEAAGTDVVYNYGMFDTRQPHFVWHFILGETDYMVAAEPFDDFVRGYVLRGRYVDEQVLDLSPDEARTLRRRLEENVRPENCRYRYNFLYDNCTTRAVAQVEASLRGRLLMGTQGAGGVTYREMIHRHIGAAPWLSFGQDLLIGAETDTVLSVRGEMFAPLYAEGYLEDAVVERADGSRPLVSRTLRHEPAAWAAVAADMADVPRGLTPLMAACLLLAAVVAVSVAGRRRPLAGRVLDAVLTVGQGATGCIVALLFCCSQHPAVGSNWLVVWLNPLPLLWLPLGLWRGGREWRGVLCLVETVLLLAFFALAAAGVQRFPAAACVLALSLLIRYAAGCRPLLARALAGRSAARRKR